MERMNQAMREAYASGDRSESVIETVELNHPSFDQPARVYMSDESPTPYAALDAAALARQGWIFTRPSTGTYFDSNGVMRTAAVNEPRYQHNPLTGQRLGILIEGGRTNIMLYSQELDIRTYSQIVPAANAALAPDGAMTADRLSVAVGNSAAVQKRAYRAVSTVIGTYCRSLFIKRESMEISFVALNSDTMGITWFDLNARTWLLSGVSIKAGIDDIGGGWLRLWVVWTSTVDDALDNMFIILSNRAATTQSTAIPDGASILVWGEQVELGEFPSSYIPTTDFTAMRSAEAFSKSGDPGENCTIALDTINNDDGPTSTTFMVDVRHTTTSYVRISERTPVMAIYYQSRDPVAAISIARPPGTAPLGLPMRAGISYSRDRVVGADNGVATIVTEDGWNPAGRPVSILTGLWQTIRAITIIPQALNESQLLALVASDPSATEWTYDFGLGRYSLDADTAFLPLEFGEAPVPFTACAFRAVPPGFSDDGPTEWQLGIDNVSGLMNEYLEATLGDNRPITVTYRAYRLNDLTAPGEVIDGYMLRNVEMKSTSATGTLFLEDIATQAFPRATYDLNTYPGLWAR